MANERRLIEAAAGVHSLAHTFLATRKEGEDRSKDALAVYLVQEGLPESIARKLAAEYPTVRTSGLPNSALNKLAASRGSRR